MEKGLLKLHQKSTCMPSENESDNAENSMDIEEVIVDDRSHPVNDEDDEVSLCNEHKTSIHPPSKTTNFTISEILKPTFGCKNKENDHSYEPYTNGFCRQFICRISSFSQHYIQNKCSFTRDVLKATPSRTASPDHASDADKAESGAPAKLAQIVSPPWPAWVYCTRYSDRPSAGPRSRKTRHKDSRHNEKRPRTAFTIDQLMRLKAEFESCRYLTEQRRQELSKTLNLSEPQIKIWFQNKRAKIKKSNGGPKSPLALHLMAQGLYNHSPSVPTTEHEDN